MIAALFVATGGCYFGLPDIDPWDVTRDARLYAGPWPVVAHPPCQLWTNLAYVNFKRYGGDHNRPGNDGGCFAAALASVRAWGGVLEHPASSHAWRVFDLPRPPSMGGWLAVDVGYRTGPDDYGEWVCEVWQSAYGHRARKRTWLFYAGSNEPAALDWSHPDRDASVRLVRSHQADARQARGVGHAAAVPRHAARPGPLGILGLTPPPASGMVSRQLGPLDVGYLRPRLMLASALRRRLCPSSNFCPKRQSAIERRISSPAARCAEEEQTTRWSGQAEASDATGRRDGQLFEAPRPRTSRKPPIPA